MADRRPSSSSNDRLRLPGSNAGERGETSSSSTVQPSNPESRTRTPAVSMPMSAPTHVPQPHTCSFINMPRNPAPTYQQLGARFPSLTEQVSALKTRIAALESEGAKLKAMNERLETENVNLKEEHRTINAENDALIDIGAKVYQLSPWLASEPLDCPKLIKEWRNKLVASLSLAHEVLAGCLAGGYILPKGLPNHLVPSYKKAMALSKSLPDILDLTEQDVGLDSSANIADYATSSDGDDSGDSDYSDNSQSDIEVESESEGGSESGTASGDSSMESSLDEPPAKKLKSDNGNDGMEETTEEIITKLIDDAINGVVPSPDDYRGNY